MMTRTFMGGRVHILDFISRYKRDEEQSPEVMAFLHDAFCNILCNVPADKALNLQGKAGRDPVNIIDKIKIYNQVLKMSVQDRGLKLDRIFEAVGSASKPALGVRQVQKYYEECSTQLNLGGINEFRKKSHEIAG
jgi:hypothetical protein